MASTLRFGYKSAYNGMPNKGVHKFSKSDTLRVEMYQVIRYVYPKIQ